MPLHSPSFGVSVDDGIYRWTELQDYIGMGD